MSLTKYTRIKYRKVKKKAQLKQLRLKYYLQIKKDKI